MVQWLGLSTFIARARVQSLVGELRSCKLCGVVKKKKKKNFRKALQSIPPPRIAGKTQKFKGWKSLRTEAGPHRVLNKHSFSLLATSST